MNRKGSLVTGVTLAALLGTGLTATAPGIGVRTASAWDAQDTAEEESLAAQWFHVDGVSVEPDGHGKEKVTGYVYNDYADMADQVRLRVIALDQSGKEIGSYLEWLTGPVAGGDRAYFDVKVPVQAASYRVVVDSFNFDMSRH